MVTAPARARPTTTIVQRWTLVLASVGSFVVILDLFAVSTALPASGVFSTVRQVGGAFGVAVTSAAFASAGGYGDVAAGYRAAMAVAAGLAAAGLLAVLAAGPRR